MARPRLVSDEDILSVARSCFLEHGPQVTTQVIADQLGVSQAALFKRFHTKSDLMLAALRPTEPTWLVRLAEGPDARPVEEQLLGFASEMARTFDQTFPCFAALKASGLSPEDLFPKDEEPFPLRAHHALTGWIRSAVEAGRVRPVDPSAIATLILGALHSRAFLSHFLGARLGSSEEQVREMVTVVWSGIRPEDRP